MWALRFYRELSLSRSWSLEIYFLSIADNLRDTRKHNTSKLSLPTSQWSSTRLLTSRHVKARIVMTHVRVKSANAQVESQTDNGLSVEKSLKQQTNERANDNENVIFLSWLTALISIPIAWVTSGIFTSFAGDEKYNPTVFGWWFSILSEFFSLFANIHTLIKSFFSTALLLKKTRIGSSQQQASHGDSQISLLTDRKCFPHCDKPHESHLIKHFAEWWGSFCFVVQLVTPRYHETNRIVISLKALL